MNLIQQHMENVSREEAQLEERAIRLKAEQDETRKLLNNIRRYRKSLCKQYPSSQATLPLAPPDEDEEEEEATDEAPESESPSEQSPGYESPEEYDSDHKSLDEETLAKNYEVPSEEPAPAEPEKPIRRRKAKAAAEE